MQDWLLSILSSFLPLEDYYLSYVYKLVLLVGILVVSWILYRLFRDFVLVRIKKLIIGTKTDYDDLLLKHKFLDVLSYFVPIYIIYLSLSWFDNASWELVISRVLASFVAILLVLSIRSFLNVLVDIYSGREIAKERPIKGYVQVVKIIVYILGGVFIISFLTNTSPWAFLTGIGAMTAILLLVFKDTILSLVASFQISSNKLFHVGDWVEFQKYGADGTVIDVSLNTVKVSNWDKTISTIPTYAFVSGSFKNWRGMEEGDGRRIKRSINLDINTIHFCSDEELNSFLSLALIKDYLSEKRKEIDDYKKANNIPESDLSSRRLSNVGIFRKYIFSYLSANPNINKDMTFIVRQLAPGEYGLPIEIYVFSKDKVWANYEDIQSDIFDHLISVLHVFGLRVFQQVTGYDLSRALRKDK